MAVGNASTLAELAAQMIGCTDDTVRMRMVLAFIDGCAALDESGRANLIVDEPALVDADLDDIRFLARHLGISDLAGVQRVVGEIFPGESLSERATSVIEDVLAASPD